MNRIEINEAKFERVMWRRNGNEYVGTLEIVRKVLGDFSVTLRVAVITEKTNVEVRNYMYPALNWSEDYESYRAAIEGVKKYFDEVAETRVALAKAEEEAEKAKREKVTEALIELLKSIGEHKDGN